MHCSDPLWRDDVYNETCDQYHYGRSAEDASELKAQCTEDTNAAGVLALDACQLTCRSTRCALPADCVDDASWKHVRMVGPGKTVTTRCADFAAGKPGHRTCCKVQGVKLSGTSVLAKDACPASCRTCDARLDDLEFWGTEDSLLVVLALLPLLLRAADVARAVQKTLHCCNWPWTSSSSRSQVRGDTEGNDWSPKGSVSLRQNDASLELEHSPLKLSPASNASSPEATASSSPVRLDHEQMDVRSVWTGSARLSGGDNQSNGGKRLTWEEGRRRRGLAVSEAIQLTLYRLLGWHCCPPLVYAWIVREYYVALDDESIWFQWLAVLVGMREVAHLVLALWCVVTTPMVFLVDLQATLINKHAVIYLIICLFGPWLFLLRVAFPMHEMSAGAEYRSTPNGKGAGGTCRRCDHWCSEWLQLARQEPYISGLVASFSLLEMCNVFAFVVGLIIVSSDSDGKGPEGQGDLVPVPMLVCFFMGSIAWFTLVKTVLLRNPAEDDSDSSEDDSDDDQQTYA